MLATALVIVAAAAALLVWRLWPDDATLRSDFVANDVQLSAWCAPDAQGHYPEGLARVDSGETPDYAWAEGGGCVHRPLKEAWSVLHDIPYLIGYHKGRVDRYEVEVVTPQGPGFTHHYDVEYEVDELFTVAWTMAWTHELLEGSYEAPRHVVVRYRRVEGSDFMPYWEGSMVLEAVTDDVTAVFIHDEIKTMRTDAASSARVVRGFFSKFIEGKPALEAMQLARRRDS